jgi:acyl-CoA thioester hydrolase
MTRARPAPMALSPNLCVQIECKPGFGDLDPMQIVWHGNYVRFLEQARETLMDKIGYSYNEMHQSGLAWPIVDLRIKYIRPIRLAQGFRVVAHLLEYENRLKIDYEIYDIATGDCVTRAQTVQLAVTLEGELVFQSPDELIEKVRKLL